jgi:AraC-like DNA-binding protein
MTLLIPAVTIRAALAGFRAVGLDTDALMRHTGLTEVLLNAPFGAAPDRIFQALWQGAYAQSPDLLLPLRVGLATPEGEFGVFDHLVESCDTVGEAMMTMRLFFHLVAATLRWEVTSVEPPGAGYRMAIYNEPPDFSDPISDQWTIALVVQRFRRTVENFQIEQITLSPSEFTPNAAEASALLGIPVHVEPRYSSLQLPMSTWLQPVGRANPRLHRTLRSVAEQAEIQAIAEAPLIWTIRTRLTAATEEGEISAQAVAAQLGLSLRTLQRRLADELISFEELLDAYRQEEAMRLLRRPEANLSAVALELGYREQSSFTRAFKRWTGQTPSKWQAQERRAL